MASQIVKMSGDGRFAIPVKMRRQLGFEKGTSLRVVMQDDALVVQSIPKAMARAKALIAQYVPDGVSLVDELIADRRAEAARENE